MNILLFSAINLLKNKKHKPKPVLLIHIMV